MSVDQNRAWKYLHDLSYIWGKGTEEEKGTYARVTGTEGERLAAEYLKKCCEELGIPAVIEEYEIDHSDIHTAELTLKGGKGYTAYGVAHTGNTPAEGITAPFRFVTNGDQDADLVDLKGKIALVTGRVSPKLARTLKEKGAVAYVVSVGGYFDDERIANGPRVPTMKAEAEIDLPGVAIHMRDVKDLVCNHQGEELTLKLDQTPCKWTARNVIAEIPGSECPDEVLVLSAHFDTVIYALGSWDNGTGCVTLLEAMNHFKANPPKRTVRFLWCGSEEIGLVGSKKYCEMHKDELGKVIYNINIDMLGAPLSRNLFCASASEATYYYTETYAKMKGWAFKGEMGMYSSDSSSFANAGVPACSFGQDMPRGGAEIHNYRDTLDEVDPKTLIDAIAFVVDYAGTIVNAKVNPIPRSFAPKVTERMEQMKKMFADMEPKKDEEKKSEKAGEKKEEK